MADINKIIEAFIVRSDKDTHFTGALATNAIEEESITGLPSSFGFIESVTLTSDQNLDWDIEFWGKDGFSNTDADVEVFLGMVKFVVADGTQEAASGLYRYCTSMASYPFRPFPYVDNDFTKELHITLVNRNATSKIAGGTGEVVVTVMFRPDGTNV